MYYLNQRHKAFVVIFQKEDFKQIQQYTDRIYTKCKTKGLSYNYWWNNSPVKKGDTHSPVLTLKCKNQCALHIPVHILYKIKSIVKWNLNYNLGNKKYGNMCLSFFKVLTTRNYLLYK